MIVFEDKVKAIRLPRYGEYMTEDGQVPIKYDLDPAIYPNTVEIGISSFLTKKDIDETIEFLNAIKVAM